jgi:aquaporin Z
MSIVERFRLHWPEYLIEAWALGCFMVSAGLVTLTFEHPASPLRIAIDDGDLRRVLIGIGMGLTAVALIYSPWGKRSGAHMNPAVTLTFWRLGKIAGGDAAFFIAAQFLGGLFGVLLVWALADRAFADPPVSFVATVPGAGGVTAAFAGEATISFGLMFTVLFVSNRERIATYTGLCAGVLVASYISLEAPLSGMSMNPARSLASAAPAGNWQHLWIYFAAPLLGMLSAAEVYHRLFERVFGQAPVRCAKLQHPNTVRCIHCGYEPPPVSHPAKIKRSLV